MKKLLFCLILIATNLSSFSQFYPASVPEDTYPPPGPAFRSHHASAYSYEDLAVGSNNFDLYVYSWDGGSIVGGMPIPNSGFAIRQYTSGNAPGSGAPISQYYNPLGFPVGDAASIEVVLLKRSNDILVLSAYYQISTQRYMLNLFKWNGSTLTQEAGYPIDITVSVSTVGFEWIRMDALTLDKFILTWGENGRIFTKAGVAGASISYGQTVRLNLGDADYDQPDVALIDVIEGEPQAVKAHYVYTTTDHQNLYVGGLLFNDVLTASAGATLSPMAEDAQTTTGEYLLPRIDAPDKFATDDWSYVVENSIPTTGSTIFSGIMHQANGLIHRNLNDASESGFPTLNLVAANNTNTKPVLAYAAGGTDIYYCWGYSGDNPIPPTSFNYSLIGLKADNMGNFLPPTPSDIKYSLVPTQLERVSVALSIALSGNNMNSAGLFMAFAQIFAAGGGTYTMGIKVSPWSDAHFRPDNTDELELLSSISVYPNPFPDYIQLNTKNSIAELTLHLYDPLGRLLLQCFGKPSDLNRQLQQRSNKLAVGNYLLYVKAAKEAPKVFKLSKTQ